MVFNLCMHRCKTSLTLSQVDYILRCILHLRDELPVLLHSALMGKNIDVKPHQYAEDMSRYFK